MIKKPFTKLQNLSYDWDASNFARSALSGDISCANSPWTNSKQWPAEAESTPAFSANRQRISEGRGNSVFRALLLA